VRLPCVREHENLRWLRARLFQAPEPLAAGACWRGGMPTFQFLLTRAVPDARTLDAFLAASAAAERALVLDELAREVARMHALGFIHHDLFPRNILVTDAGPSRVWFLDCWAGGPGHLARGPAYDLACLTLGAEPFAADEVERLFAAYLDERRAQDRPADVLELGAATERARAALAQRATRNAAPLAPLPWPRS
jgi:tRNA A-37 threonylcarbamoyl transferase component Bud32